MPAESFSITTETQVASVDTQGIGAAITNFLVSFPEFIPIALTPKIPPLKPTEITNDPDAALKAWIPATIYCNLAASCTVVFGAILCEGMGSLRWIFSNFVSAFFSGWWLWYTGVKVHWSDRRCPCCLGNLCYLFMALLYAIQFLYLIQVVLWACFALLRSLTHGFCIIYGLLCFCSVFLYLPVFYLALANLFIYQKNSGQTIISVSQVAAVQASVKV